ncbi:MAG: hypothetical protein ACKOXK_02470 [Chakrabartia sp.]
MTFSTKAMLAGLSGSLLLTAMPAEARDYRRHHDGIDAGDVIAGALIIGGIAAIASAASRDRGGYGYRDTDYRGYDSRAAVEQCVRAAQREARQYGNWARVTDVTRVERVRDGYEVRGRLVVDRGYADGRYGRDGSGSGWDDRRWGEDGWRRDGWDRNDRWGYRYDRYGSGYDKGRFSCVTRYGRIDDLDLRGLRG